MKGLGWMLVLALAECFFMFCWLWPVPQPGMGIAVTRSVFSNYLPVVPQLQVFALFVAAPLSIFAAYLIDRGDDER